jgi:hypothetical protein
MTRGSLPKKERPGVQPSRNNRAIGELTLYPRGLGVKTDPRGQQLQQIIADGGDAAEVAAHDLALEYGEREDPVC